LAGVHLDLRKVILRAVPLSPHEFVITEGMRTRERQVELVKAGASKTMNSRHLTGHAVDLAPVIGGYVRWDWPLFFDLARAVQHAAIELNIVIEWGGCWCRLNEQVPVETLHARYVNECHTNHKRPFMDGPHFQLPWDTYRIGPGTHNQDT